MLCFLKDFHQTEEKGSQPKEPLDKSSQHKGHDEDDIHYL